MHYTCPETNLADPIQVRGGYGRASSFSYYYCLPLKDLELPLPPRFCNFQRLHTSTPITCASKPGLNKDLVLCHKIFLHREHEFRMGSLPCLSGWGLKYHDVVMRQFCDSSAMHMYSCTTPTYESEIQ